MEIVITEKEHFKFGDYWKVVKGFFTNSKEKETGDRMLKLHVSYFILALLWFATTHNLWIIVPLLVMDFLLIFLIMLSMFVCEKTYNKLIEKEKKILLILSENEISIFKQETGRKEILRYHKKAIIELKYVFIVDNTIIVRKGTMSGEILEKYIAEKTL